MAILPLGAKVYPALAPVTALLTPWSFSKRNNIVSGAAQVFWGCPGLSGSTLGRVSPKAANPQAAGPITFRKPILFSPCKTHPLGQPGQKRLA